MPPAEVMVVDDDVDIRETLTEILQELGYPVIAAENGAVALDLLRAGARPAVILLDLAMPRMNGRLFCLAHQADPALSTIPIVILSASRGTRGEAEIPGATAQLSKPVELARLTETVARYCGPVDA